MPRILDQLGYSSTLYKTPERIAPDDARLNRIRSELDRVGRLEANSVRLSPANKFHLQRLKEFETNFSADIANRRKQVERLERLDITPRNLLAHKRAKSELFQLLQRQSALRQRASSETRERLGKASAADARYFYPYNTRNPRSVFGTEALTRAASLSRRIFRNPITAIPCVSRAVRREVLFARGHGHKGHRGKRRFNPLSSIGC